MPKIPALPPMTSPADADEVPIEDVSASTTKYLTLVKLKEWFQGLTSWITTAMITDEAVTSEKITSTVAFLARRTTDQTGVVTGTITTMQAATETFDIGSDYDNTTYTFTAPYDGVYHFEMTALVDAPGTLCSGYIRVNGSTVAKNDITDATASQDRNAPTTITLSLTAGDTVTAAVAHNAGSNRTITGSVTGSCYFSGHLVGRT